MFTDSYSIFSYLKAAHLKFPAEKATYLHLAYLKELLDAKAVKSLTWVDTRDMVCDGLTKGMADRSALHRLMAGVWKLSHPCETFLGGESVNNNKATEQKTSETQSQHLLAELLRQTTCQQLLAQRAPTTFRQTTSQQLLAQRAPTTTVD